MAATPSPEEFAASVEQLANVDIDALKKQPNFEISRRKALTAARSLFKELENPYELTRRVGWADATEPAAIKIALDLGLLKELQRHDGTSGVTSEAVAKATHQHPELVERTLRHLTANRIVKQTGQNKYAALDKSNALLDPQIASGVHLYTQFFAKSISYLPLYLAEASYEERTEPGKTSFEQAFGLPFFPWLKEHPTSLTTFMTHLKFQKQDRYEWVDTFPTKERLVDGANETGPLVVDVGGGVGQATQAFFNRFPQPKGRLYVQDFEHVLKEAHTDPAIELQPHDFLTPQPVCGARAYLLQFILHDWVDDECLKILAHLRDAMTPGYSKLIVSEYVIAVRNPDPLMTALDWAVESVLGAKERTEQDWHDLFAKAGMKIEGIYSLSSSAESVIEVVLA